MLDSDSHLALFHNNQYPQGLDLRGFTGDDFRHVSYCVTFLITASILLITA